jgi:hypothetical protein
MIQLRIIRQLKPMGDIDTGWGYEVEVEELQYRWFWFGWRTVPVIMEIPKPSEYPLKEEK